MKNLGRVGTHIFFWRKNIISCILKGISPFKMHKLSFFSHQNMKKSLGFTSKFWWGQVTLKTCNFLFGLIELVAKKLYNARKNMHFISFPQLV